MLELRPCRESTIRRCRRLQRKRASAYECILSRCVDVVLENGGPNCGGGFVPHPALGIGGALTWKGSASRRPKRNPVNAEDHARFSAVIKAIAPKS
jgi:hypothetical protein